MDLSREDVRRQLDLEAEAVSLGKARYLADRPHIGDKTAKEEANLPPGLLLIRTAIGAVTDAVREFVDAAHANKAGRFHSSVKWLERAAPEEVAYLGLRAVLNGAAKQATFQSIALSAADALIDHLDMNRFKEVNPGGYVGLTRKMRHGRGSDHRMQLIRKMLASEEARLGIPQTEKLHLGHAIASLVIESTDLFVQERRHRKSYIVRPTEATARWLNEQHLVSSLRRPMWLPMVIRPRRWRTGRTGGYLRPRRYSLVRSNIDRKFYEAADLTKVYEAVNSVQETAWSINRRVLAVLQEAWNEGGNVGGLPPAEMSPLPPKPHDISTNEEARRAWRRAAYEHHAADTLNDPGRIRVRTQLWVATKFEEEPQLYIPHNLDFRGRMYPISTVINPQGDDIDRALLQFAHGLPIGKSGGSWLAIHIANLFGVDKVPFEDRVNWTYAHANELIDSALDPVGGQRFWATADSPFSALAACFEFADYLDQGETFVSRLPIPLDGSNSGLQHYSALLRDEVGAAAVNLLPSDKPADIYSDVATLAQAKVDADENPMGRVWAGKVTRKIAKQPCMTYAYSATRYGMQKMIANVLTELDEGGEPYLGGEDNGKAAVYLSYVLLEAISETVSKATEAMDWLKEAARAVSSVDLPLRWTTPDGLPIEQRYTATNLETVKVHWKGAQTFMSLAGKAPYLSVRSQVNGVAPNLIHSFDGAHLRSVVRAAHSFGIRSLAVVHDSFASHAARVDDLADILRATFVAQYTPDLLAALKGELEALSGLTLPALPQPGSLDLNATLRAQYLFS